MTLTQFAHYLLQADKLHQEGVEINAITAEEEPSEPLGDYRWF